MRGISKAFRGVQALKGVDFTVRAGEIHALMGENGAGKSTLIKVLTGVHPRDSGDVLLAGQSVSPQAPREAEELGISTVYQEINLIPELSVAENIMLGRQPRRFGFIDWKELHARARRALQRLEIDLDLHRSVSSCSLALQQMVAIARALDVNAKLLILDEPTSSLDEHEVAELFKVMRRLREQGLGLVFVTHFMDQVYAVSDSITVLRNGELVGEFKTAELPKLQLVGKMLGRELAAVEKVGDTIALSAEGRASRDVFLAAKQLGRKGGVEPLDLEIRKGEVVGLAGLLGSGRTETARLLFGADRKSSGSITLDGRATALSSPAKAIGEGIAFCSEDRKSEGIVPSLSVRENIILAMQAGRGFVRLLPRRKQEELAAHYIQALRIKTPSPETPIQNLSGGNQQKVLLARWLCLQPKLIILDEPTRGIDVGAKAEIEKLVDSLRREGMAILFISSELEEVVRASQRVLVLRDRTKVGELSGEQINEDRIMEMIATHE
jgi:simple sugar transport system ATP-binding protein